MAQGKGGEADSYYNQGPGDLSNGQYGSSPPMHYPPQAANNANSNPKYQQPPPNYAQNPQDPASRPMAAGDGKQTFDQVFKLGQSISNGLLLLQHFSLNRETRLGSEKRVSIKYASGTFLVTPLLLITWAPFSYPVATFV